jgi:hypothetical protein
MYVVKSFFSLNGKFLFAFSAEVTIFVTSTTSIEVVEVRGT